MSPIYGVSMIQPYAHPTEREGSYIKFNNIIKKQAVVIVNKGVSSISVNFIGVSSQGNV